MESISNNSSPKSPDHHRLSIGLSQIPSQQLSYTDIANSYPFYQIQTAEENIRLGKRGSYSIQTIESSKKAKHKKIEQKRRDGIKEKFSRLKNVVPHCTNETQAVVLEKAVEHIQFLTAQYDDLLNRCKQLQDEYRRVGGKYDYDILGHHLIQPATHLSPRKLAASISDEAIPQLNDDQNDTSLPLPVQDRDGIKNE